MPVRLRFYGWPKEAIGAGEVEVEGEGLTVEEIVRKVDSSGRVVEALLNEELFIILNHSRAVSPGFKPRDGDLIAIFPEPSGG